MPVVATGNCLATGTSISAAFPGLPIQADTVGAAGYYTCDYTWVGFAAGGCITV